MLVNRINHATIHAQMQIVYTQMKYQGYPALILEIKEAPIYFHS